KVCTGEDRSGEIGVAETGASELSAFECGTAQIYPRQVDGLWVGHRRAAAQDTQSRLNVRGTHAHPGKTRVHGDRGMFRTGRRTDGPRRMVADEGSEDELYGVAVGGRVLGDALKGIDAADA